jgi:hypothetical protein
MTVSIVYSLVGQPLAATSTDAMPSKLARVPARSVWLWMSRW